MCEAEAEKMSERIERNAKRRARRATLRAFYGENAPGTSKYGAAMGRPSWGLLTGVIHRGLWLGGGVATLPDGAHVVVQRVTGHDGGDYDRCGTYWGGLRESPLFWVAVLQGETLVSEAFLRADSRARVVHKLRERLKGFRVRSFAKVTSCCGAPMVPAPEHGPGFSKAACDCGEHDSEA